MTRDKLEALVWKHTHKDFRSVLDGIRTVLHRSVTRGTCIVPISALTEIQLRLKLPAKVREATFGPDPSTLPDILRQYAILAAELGHTALKCGRSFECPTCGASGALVDDYISRPWCDGAIFTDPCSNPTTPTRR